MEKEENILGYEKIGKLIRKFAVPCIISLLVNSLYNIVDQVFIGWGVGILGNGATNVVFPLTMICLAFALMFGDGGAAYLSLKLGEKKQKEAAKGIGNAITISIIVSILLCATYLIFLPRLLNLFGCTENIRPFALEYGWIIVIGLPFMMIGTTLNSIIRADGNPKYAMTSMVIGAILNVILDPIFIYIFNMGVSGAALATLVANTIMFLLYRRKSMSFLRYYRGVKLDFVKVKEICVLGIPMSFQRVLFTLINIVLARIIGGFGANAIAAQKIGLQIESITYMVIGGLHGAISSFVGQNFGAGKYNRIKEGYKTALKLGILYSLMMVFVFVFLNRPIIKLFISENETIIIAADYLRIVAFSQIFSTIETISNGTFTGLGLPKIPSLISIVFTALRIPMALMLVGRFGVNGVWMSISISSILKGITSYIMYFIVVKMKL